MTWPLSQDYNEAIQDAATNFHDPELKRGEVAVNSLGLPLPRSGNFADVYEVRCPATGNKWAVKCFTRQVAGQAERYSQIGRHLEKCRLPFTVDFQYLPNGIRVQGYWYPVLKMRWVEGSLLNEFVRDQADKPVLLHALGQIWLRMSRRLREAGIAHADLQHGNVLLVPGRKMQSLSVKLIDYDGMYVPALAGKKSGEVGHANYQHPQRIREGTYSAEVDRFALLAVSTALRAVEIGGHSLWQRYDNGDNLLFKEADLQNPGGSVLFAELRQSSDPVLKTLTARLQQACHASLDQAALLQELIVEEKTKGKAATAANVWDFSGPDASPMVAAPSRRRSASMWGWMAAGVVGVMVAAGGVFLAARGRHGIKQESSKVALNDAALTTSSLDSTRAPQEPETTPANPVIAVPAREKESSSSKSPVYDGAVNLPERIKPPDDPTPIGPMLLPDRVELPPQKPEVKPDVPKPVVFEKPAMWPPRLFRMLSPTDIRLAMTDGTNEWRLMDMANIRAIRKFVGHEAPVTCVAVSADGRRALTGSEDKAIRLWDLESGACLAKFGGHEGTVKAVALSADGNLALTVDGSVNVLSWELVKGPVPLRFKATRPVYAVALSPDGSHFALGTLASQDDNTAPILLYETQTGKRVRQFTGHAGAVTCLAFSPDGQRLASGGMDRDIHIWDLNGNATKATTRLTDAAVNLSFFSQGRRVLAETPNNGYVLTADKALILATAGIPGGHVGCYSLDEGANQIIANVMRADYQNLFRTWGKINTEVVARKPRMPRGVKRAAIPNMENVTAARKELHEVFKDNYAKTALNDRVDLANKVSNYGRTAADPAMRYTALQESRDLWAQIGVISAAYNSVRDLAEAFSINPLQAKWEVLDMAARAGGGFTTHPHPVDYALRLLEEAKAAEDFDLAIKITETAARSANKAHSATLVDKVVRAGRETALARGEFKQISKHLATLAKTPTDREANLVVGRYRCCFLDCWEEGLPSLAQGSDAGLQAAAKKDLEDTDTPAGYKQRGDLWNEQAKRATGPVQAGLRRRAAFWYWQAYAGLGSTQQTELVKSRLTPLAKAMPELVDPWFLFDTSEAARKGEYLHLDQFKVVPTRHQFRGGIDVTVVARTPKDNIRLTAGDGARVIFNWEGEGGGTHVYRPDGGGRIDGRGLNGGSPMNPGNTEVELKPNRWYTLRWRMAPDGMKVWVDGKLVLEKEETFDLSYFSPVAVCSFQTPIDVKSMTAKGLGWAKTGPD
jgi:WD40 repeat protein